MIETQSVTEFHGNEGSGRSAFAHQLAVTSQLPAEQGGLEGGCVYIDSRDAFRPELIRTIIENLPVEARKALYESHGFPQNSGNTGELSKSLLDQIHVSTPESTVEQILAVEQAKEVIENNDIGAIVVDSLTHWFREEYSGRDELAERQQKLNKHLLDISRLAELYDCCAIVTNGMTTGSKPAGGNVVSHKAMFRIHLKKTAGTVRRAHLIDAPNMPTGEIDFRLEDSCITPK